MICGALQTLNEDAFEDVVSNERSPSNGPGEQNILMQHLTTIREGSEFGSPTHNNSVNSYDELFEENNKNNNNLNRFDESPNPSTVILMPHYTPNIDDTQL